MTAIQGNYRGGKRTKGMVVDGGVYLPPNACVECNKWLPPYKAGVPSETAHLYCWGHQNGSTTPPPDAQ